MLESSTFLNLNLSSASDAFETNSLKKFLYLNTKNESLTEAVVLFQF